jgi:hypothetical protein
MLFPEVHTQHQQMKSEKDGEDKNQPEHSDTIKQLV